jgi:hypothetical protein
MPLSVAKTPVYFLVFPKNVPVAFLVSFGTVHKRAPEAAPRGRGWS